MKKQKTMLFPILSIVAVSLLGLLLLYNKNIGKEDSVIKDVVYQEVDEKMSHYVTEWLGKTMPEIHVQDIKNQNQVIGEVQDKPRVYVFWASWCPDCQNELPVIESLYKRYNDKIDFVTVDLVGFRNESREQALAYYQESKFTFPIYFDDSQLIIDKLEIVAIPTVLFVDSDNNIANIVVETGGEDIIKYYLEDLIS